MELLWKTGRRHSVFHGKKQLFRAGALETRDAIVCSLFLRFPHCPGVEVTAVALLGGGGCLGGGFGGKPLGLWGHSLNGESRAQSLPPFLLSCYVVSHFLPLATPATPPRLTGDLKAMGLMDSHWILYSLCRKTSVPQKMLLLGTHPSGRKLTNTDLDHSRFHKAPKRKRPLHRSTLSGNKEKLAFPASIYFKRKKKKKRPQHLLCQLHAAESP